MKKTLIALAALAASAAYAQSTVEIYGRLDLGMSSIKTTENDAGDVTTTKTNSFAGAQHGRTTSRLGFRGTEDLGGGLKASFNYEFKLEPDNTGAGTSAAGTTRLANLGLNGGFGTVVIGTFLNSFDTVRGYSPATYSIPGGDFLANHGGVSGRSTNAIAYRSPSMGGFAFGVGYTNETTKTTDVGVVTADNKASAYLLSAAYANGPLKVDFAYANGKAQTGPGATLTKGKVNDYGLAASYDLGFMVGTFQYESGKATGQLLAGVPLVSTYAKFNAMEIGAKFPMGAFTPYVTIGSGKLKAAVEAPEEKADTSSWQIGTTYDLSKRTYVYAGFGQFKVKEKAADWSQKTTGYKVGLVHQF